MVLPLSLSLSFKPLNIGDRSAVVSHGFRKYLKLLPLFFGYCYCFSTLVFLFCQLNFRKELGKMRARKSAKLGVKIY